MIEPGSVVTLRSGGPIMTVEAVDYDHEGSFGVAACVWFMQEGDAFRVQHIALSALREVEDEYEEPCGTCPSCLDAPKPS